MNALQAWPALACWPEVINYHTLNDLCIKYGEALLSGPLRISRVRRGSACVMIAGLRLPDPVSFMSQCFHRIDPCGAQRSRYLRIV
jgi:hypothetical protein